MFIITLDGKESEGAYSVINEDGEHIIYLFEEEDDAVRYAMLLEEDGYPEMHVMEVENELMIRTCQSHGYQYSIITPNDIVIPPSNTHDFI